MGNFEDDIKQKKFKNDIHKAVLNIMYTANWIRDQSAPVFKEFGILDQHYNILRIIRGRKGESVSPGQIIKVMLDKGRDLTRLIDKLVKFGYLERSQSLLNRRKMDISITEKGLQITADIETKINNWVESHLKISEEDAKALNTLLDQIRIDD